jgi:hypothetical protein
MPFRLFVFGLPSPTTDDQQLATNNFMDTGKLAIGITAAAFAGFGAVLMAKPEKILRIAGIKATNATGRTELRAMYGGMELGFGAFFIMALKQEWREPALVAILCAIGTLGATRVATAISEGAGPMTYAMAAPEVAAATLAGIALLHDRNNGE